MSVGEIIGVGVLARIDGELVATPDAHWIANESPDKTASR
jgi:hypothetical protein